MATGSQRLLARAGAVVLAAWLLIAAVTVYTSSRPGRDGTSSAPSPTAGASLPEARPSTTPASPSPRPSSAAPTTRTTGSTASSPFPSPQQTGPGVTEPGVLVRALVAANGDLAVEEHVLLASPVISVAVAPPQAGGAPGLAGISPSVAGLRVVADGKVQALKDGDLSDAVVVDLSLPATTLELSYTLRGATKRSRPAPAGRAMVALPPISTVGPGDLPVVVQVFAAGIRNLTCPFLRTEQVLCGRQGAGMWVTAPIPRDFAVVHAQLDLSAGTAR